jgi:hypothetical protein
VAEISIRRVRPYDVSNIYRLLEEAHVQTPEYPAADGFISLSWIASTLAEGYVIVADISGRLVGTLALTNYRPPWTTQWYMYLEWLYVQKKFRSYGVFDALMAAAHHYADEKKAPIWAGISAAGHDVFMKDRLLRMKGYTYIGGTFVRSASHGQQQEEDHADIQAASVG